MRQFGFKKSHILVGFAMLACLVPLYWAKSEADRMLSHMQKLQAEVKDARKNVKTLEAELAFLSRYDRIEKTAIEQLGMAPLNGAQVIEIKDINNVLPLTETLPKPHAQTLPIEKAEMKIAQQAIKKPITPAPQGKDNE